MAKRYDVIVVGAGPAGLMAAKTAGENGLSVAVLDRKTAIGRIARCDGGGYSINLCLFEEYFNFNPKNKRLLFPNAGFSVKYEGPYRYVYGFHFYSPNGKRVAFGNVKELKEKGIKGAIGLCTDKGDLLRSLLKEAQENSVEVFRGINVNGIKKIDEGVVVSGNGEDFEGKFVIAADGVNSRIARLMGMNKGRKFYATMRMVTWEMEGVDFEDKEVILFIIGKEVDFSIMYQFNGNHHISAASRDPMLDLNAAIDRFIKEDKYYSSWFKNAKQVGDKQSCIVNVWEPFEEPFKENVLFIGDAAWLEEFSNPAALLSGWRAGNSITIAILSEQLNREGVSDYLEWWKKYFYQPYGSRTFNIVDINKYLKDEDLDYLASLVLNYLPGSLDFYYVFTTLGQTYAELFPKIQDERPDIIEKIMMMRSEMEEELEKQKKAGFPNR